MRTKKLSLIFLFVMVVFTNAIYSQVGIGSVDFIPNSSSILELQSNDKGLLISRIALTGTTDVVTISSPATSLLVYNTSTVSDVTPGFYYWDGSEWVRIASGSISTHNRSHTMTSTSDHTATNWRLFHSNGSGQVIELALGASGEVLQSNGASAVPSWVAQNAGTVTGSGVATRVAFWSTASALSSNADLYWDNTNSRLGVGIATPSSKLSITTTGTELLGTATSSAFRINSGALGGTATNEVNAASIGFTSVNNVSLGIRGYRSSTGADWTTSSIVLGMDVDNTTRAGAYLTLGGNGNVGIGVLAPTEKLEIGGTNSKLYMNSATSNMLYFNTNGVAAPAFTTRSAGTKLVLYPFLDGSNVDYALGIEAGTMWHSIPQASTSNLYKFYAGTTQLMQIRGDGKVSINTTTPDTYKARLEVNSTYSSGSEEKAGFFNFNYGSDYRDFMIGTESKGIFSRFNGASYHGDTYGVHSAMWNNYNALVNKYAGYFSTASDYGNKYGVYAEVPSALAKTNKAFGVYAMLYDVNGTTNHDYIGVLAYYESQKKAGVYGKVNCSDPNILHTTYGGYFSNINASNTNDNSKYGIYTSVAGAVGHGTNRIKYGTYTEATGTADENFGIWATASGATTNYAGYFSGNVIVTGTFTNPSDLRYKKDVNKISNALNVVMNNQGVSYLFRTEEFKDKNFSDKKQIGFIAQDFEKNTPELVVTDKNGYKSINYIQYVAILNEAIKEQQNLIISMQKRIEVLEATVKH